MKNRLVDTFLLVSTDEDEDGGRQGKRKMRAVRGQKKWANEIQYKLFKDA